MGGSDSEGDAPKQEAEGAPVAEGDANADDTKETQAEAKKEEGDDGPVGDKSLEVSDKPSYTLLIRNVPDDVEMSEMETRLSRHGDVVSVDREADGVVIAKFKRTQEAFQAREKLNGTSPFDGPENLKIDFGAQDADHYNRKKRTAGQGDFLDGTDAKEDKPDVRKVKAENDAAPEPGHKRRKVDDDEPESKVDKKEQPTEPRGKVTNFDLKPPTKAVSKWSEDLSFEEQLEDFMKMPRRGMYNRYLVLGKLPPELRTGEAIWRAMTPVQRDIVQVEMLTCFGKPVAHIALRSATAAAAMHRLCEQLHGSLTVAFAPPRRASATIWLGNVDDFVQRKELEVILNDYGKVQNGLRYLPARTCAFASFSDSIDAIAARNALYGLEVQRNQYLNVDFVDEGDHGAADPWGQGGPWAQGPWGSGGWGQPWAPRPPPFGVLGGAHPGRGGERGRGHRDFDRRDDGRDGRLRREPMRPGQPWGPRGGSPPGRGMDRERGGPEKRLKRRGGRSVSRSPRRGGRDEPEDPPPERRRRHKEKEVAPAPAAREESPDEAEKQKSKVKLFKMGEFCCNIVANYVSGKQSPENLVNKLHIDQRTKVDHCKSHLERAGALATIWHFSAADRRDCAAYDALCDYFVEKDRVGLVQTPAYYIYVVPPTEKFLKELGLPTSNFVVGLQIPIKK